jgi:hypothetical protein
LVDAVDDGLDGVDLIRAHHEELLLALDEHHVAADHAAEVALLEESVGKELELGDRRVVLGGEFIDREELLVGGKVEVPGIVIGEVVGLGAIGDYEELDEAEEGAGVAVAEIGLARRGVTPRFLSSTWTTGTPLMRRMTS